MSISSIYQRIAHAPLCDEIVAWAQEPPSHLRLQNATGSLPAFLLTHLSKKTGRIVACILPEHEAARYMHADMEQLSAENVLLFPPSGLTPYDLEQVADTSLLTHRADILQQLSTGFRGLLVTSIEAIYERVPSQALLQKNTLVVSIGDEIAPQTIVDRLVSQGFERTEFVDQAGEIAWRGGVLDVFPFVGQYPIRMEFFGDEIESIREFDARSQRSVSRLKKARLVPHLSQTAETLSTLWDYLPASHTLLATFDSAYLEEQVEQLFMRAKTLFTTSCTTRAEAQIPAPETLYLSREAFHSATHPYAHLHIGSFVSSTVNTTLHVNSQPPPSFHGRIVEVQGQLASNTQQGIDTFILCDSASQKTRLAELLEDEIDRGGVHLITESLHEGFVLPNLGLAIYTDHQIFDRFHRPSSRKRRKKGGLRLQELNNLQPGDFVVHIDYGVGRFGGFAEITVRDKLQESVRVYYAGDDIVYVNVHALHKLHKYVGKDGNSPRLTKLGSGQWDRAKKRAKKRVKDIARDLILLYARRKASDGHNFPPDSVWQREMEASFAFEDTPDQALASQMVKQDMEAPVPMDRLVCGDVGFGKTEVAIRAAFKAVQDGKQVAVLVPTTVLTLQHYNTFKKRLRHYPVQIEMLSRFRTRPEQKKTIAALKRGTIDIVIGTHRLVSKDVVFNNLGLFVIDEEQRFGVKVKEHLRQARANVDTLTLTATPIPRTLQFSLMGARDLSIITTPPSNRQRILTEIHSFNKQLIRDAILYETGRGGQVFFIHNRVKSIEQYSQMLRTLVPGVRIEVAHGQMESTQLERIMMRFVTRKFDVLISTTIIENGLDIANANTIILHHAQNFGLSELHQLRGRVGRSDRKAFCYLLVPSIHTLTRNARRRLQAVEEFNELGSGFHIAMRDMDIRGAGDILGSEQSGFIDEVGYETYLKILDEAVQELRQEDFSELFQDMPPRPAAEPTIKIPDDAKLPASYVSNNMERLSLYRRISETATIAGLQELRQELEDRFGALPPEAHKLLCGVELKLLALKLRLPLVQVRKQRLFLHMPSQEADPYFHQYLFRPFLQQLNHLDRNCALGETKKGHPRAIVQDVPDLFAARSVLEELVREKESV